jgi:hypothetical protein
LASNYYLPISASRVAEIKCMNYCACPKQCVSVGVMDIFILILKFKKLFLIFTGASTMSGKTFGQNIKMILPIFQF